MAGIAKYLLSIMLISSFFSCERDYAKDKAFIGTWISEDSADTLVFIDNNTFERNFYESMHAFLYSYDADSITIQYNGKFYIAVLPTTQQYNLDNNKLVIDFSNGCYGFDSKIEVFKKRE